MYQLKVTGLSLGTDIDFVSIANINCICKEAFQKSKSLHVRHEKHGNTGPAGMVRGKNQENVLSIPVFSG